MISLKEGAEPLNEPSGYCQYVLQDESTLAYWTGRINPVSPAAWTKDLQKAKVVVGLAGVVAARAQVSTIVEYEILRATVSYRKVRISYFMELEQPAEQQAVA